MLSDSIQQSLTQRLRLARQRGPPQVSYLGREEVLEADPGTGQRHSPPEEDDQNQVWEQGCEVHHLKTTGSSPPARITRRAEQYSLRQMNEDTALNRK